MRFTKMHGIGNDYVYVNAFEEKVENPAELARVVSDRHLGVGSDGLILILPSQRADVRMRMFNVDGTEGEMCGNGVRCVAKYAYDHGLTRNNPLTVETGRGVLALAMKMDSMGKVAQVTVNMGQPILELEKVPVDPQHLGQRIGKHEWRLTFSNDAARGQEASRSAAETVEPMNATPVSMGNPHVVIFHPRVDALNLHSIGPLVEHHKAFPRRVNAHWAEVISRDEVKMRTWERGSGITLACGTGASAVCVAGVLTARTGRRILVHLPGGDLHLEWRESDNCVYMTGPATEVYTGDWPGS